MSRRRLTDDQAREIFLSTEPHRTLASRFSVAHTVVLKIKARKTYTEATKDLGEPGESSYTPRKLSDNVVKIIYLSNEPYSTLAENFGVCRGTIYAIKNRREPYDQLLKNLGEPGKATKDAIYKDLLERGVFKLSVEQITSIYLDATRSQKDLADMYCVSESTVSRIKNGKLYNSITMGL